MNWSYLAGVLLPRTETECPVPASDLSGPRGVVFQRAVVLFTGWTSMPRIFVGVVELVAR